MSNRKSFGFLALALFVATAAFAGAARADETPPPIADTYEVDGITYYNVDSANFDSPKKLYEDMFSKRHSSLKVDDPDWRRDPMQDDPSMGDLWMRLAVELYQPFSGYGALKDTAREAVRWRGYGTQQRLNHICTYQAPTWNNDGYVETVIVVNNPLEAKSCAIRVRFSDFQVGVVLPGETKHYVSKTVKNDEAKNVQSASAKNDSDKTVTLGQDVIKTVTETLTSTVNNSSAYSLKEGVKASAKFTVGIFEVGTELSFEASQTFTQGWSKSQGTTKSGQIKNSIQVTLPPYTSAMLRQGESNSTVTTKYNCPVMLSYKVTIEAGDSFYKRTYTFGAEAGGARADLKQRALIDGEAHLDPQGIDWKTVLMDDVKKVVPVITTHVPMSPTGATMVFTNHTTYNEVSGIAALYPLHSVELKKPNISFVDENNLANMSVGKYSYTEYLPVVGYNDRNAEYYGFNKSYGHWIVVGEDGKELKSEAAPVLIEKTSAGYTKFRAVKPGKCRMKYIIDENCYPSALGSKKYTKNSDLAHTAILDVNVQAEKANLTYEIEGTYNGIVNSAPEKLEDDGKLEVSVVDSTGKEVDAEYEWESRERPSKGIKLDPDGTVTFTKPRTFRVRVRDKARPNEVYSAWKEITAEVLGDEDYVEEPEVPVKYDGLANDDTNLIISRRFVGGVSADQESIEGEGKLQVAVHDSTSQEEAIGYEWEELADNNDGMILTPDGDVSFTKPGLYHVRVKSRKAASAEVRTAEAESSEVYSEWVEIRANEKAPARLLRAPSTNDRPCDGTAQALLFNDARIEGGLRVLYALGKDGVTEPAEYSSEIPTAVEGGKYYVWCKVQSDEEHDDSDPVCVPVTISGSSSAFVDETAQEKAKKAIEAALGDGNIVFDLGENAIIGAARSAADLSDELSEEQLSMISSDKSVVVAVFPKIMPLKTAVFVLGFKADPALKGTLKWHGFPNSTKEGVALAEGEEDYLFLNDSGEEITSVPSNGHVNVAVKLTEGVTYAPVVTAAKDGGTSKSSGGCDAGLGSLAALSLACLAAFKFKR
ncbi:MAG: aerolysin family beta-barrel pore-forming toxin [Fretibacterium sp.]|nr:aerolysin family beta-barrel pore-forming toxin [Fretibacterium sp.]